MQPRTVFVQFSPKFTLTEDQKECTINLDRLNALSADAAGGRAVFGYMLLKCFLQAIAALPYDAFSDLAGAFYVCLVCFACVWTHAVSEYSFAVRKNGSFLHAAFSIED